MNSKACHDMFDACYNENLSEIDRLLSAETVDSGINGACGGGHVDLAKLMISHGATNFNDGLSCACMAGKLKTAQLMLDHGANNVNNGLYSACYRGQLRAAKLMISNGANNCKQSFTAATYNNHFHMFELLKSNGVTIPLKEGYEEYLAWLRCVLALPILCEDVLRMVT